MSRHHLPFASKHSRAGRRRTDGKATGAWAEALETRLMLSRAVAAAQETLGDLPVAERSAISAALTHDARLTASDGAAFDLFGDSVSISGDTIVVGAQNATIGSNSDQGAAYVFTESDTVWTQAAKLTASDGAANGGFGASVSISGDTVVVGAPGATVGANADQGAAYVFTESGTVWTQAAKLTASDGAANDNFGNLVSINGATVVIGAEYAMVGSNANQGAAYVFTESSSVWTQAAKLTASDGAAYDWFGFSVAISGATVVVGSLGAIGGSHGEQGAAYVFTESGSVWTQAAKLTASDGAAGDNFGNSVSISGNTMVIGAHNAAIGGNADQGAAYVFTESGTVWTQAAKLTASDGAAGDYFGCSASISGDMVVVGAQNATIGSNANQGAAYVFTEPVSGWVNMTQAAKLTASDGATGDNFGSSVAISGTTVVVGAQGVTVGSNIVQGAAYVFPVSTSATIDGKVFNDAKGTGVLARRDRGMSRVTVSLRLMRGRKLARRGMTFTTHSTGKYRFTGLAAGTYELTETMPSGYEPTAPFGDVYTLKVTAGQVMSAENFGNKKG